MKKNHLLDALAKLSHTQFEFLSCVDLSSPESRALFDELNRLYVVALKAENAEKEIIRLTEDIKRTKELLQALWKTTPRPRTRVPKATTKSVQAAPRGKRPAQKNQRKSVPPRGRR